MAQAKTRIPSDAKANSFTVSLGSVVKEVRIGAGLTIAELVIRGGASGRQVVDGKELTDLENGTLDQISAERLLQSGILASLLRVPIADLEKEAQGMLNNYLFNSRSTD